MTPTVGDSAMVIGRGKQTKIGFGGSRDRTPATIPAFHIGGLKTLEGEEEEMNHFKCETCGRDMGDIDEPICHGCEQHEIDVLAEQGKSKQATGQKRGN